MSGKGGIIVLDKTNLFLKADWPWEGLIPDPGVQSCCIPRDLPAGGKQLPWNISCEWMDLPSDLQRALSTRRHKNSGSSPRNSAG